MYFILFIICTGLCLYLSQIVYKIKKNQSHYIIMLIKIIIPM